MANKEGKEYKQNGKTIKIIPVKRIKKESSSADGESRPKRAKKVEEENGLAKFAVGDRVTLKNIPAEYSGYGFAEATIIKVFKSTSEANYRYSIKSNSGRELSLLKGDQLKPRK